MARKPKAARDPVSIAISVGIHVVLIGAVAYWAYTTGRLEKVRQVLLQYASEKKEEKREEPRPQPRQPRPNLPPIDTGRTPAASSGTRRAVAADAPEAAGDTFFQDTRRQVAGPSTSGGSDRQPPPSPRVAVPATAPLLPTFRAASSTTIKELFAERAREAAATEAFGSEQISKSGVSDASAIINKVAGASIVDGKFAVIRGLSDRYVSTTLNGAEVPSPDPYRRSASLDMFPAQVISKVVVAKTFTPDQPGSYTGGGIDIVTKSFPEKPFFNISGGLSYNTQATGNDNFLTSEGGGTDWLAMDDGTRALPDSLSDPDLRIDLTPPFSTGREGTDQYAERLARAQEIDQLTRAMGTVSFGPDRDAPSFNRSFAFSGGDSGTLFTRPFGYFLSMNYRRDFGFYENGISRRHGTFQSETDSYEVLRDFDDVASNEAVNWAGMVNLAYEIAPEHELGFVFLNNQNSDNLHRVQTGQLATEPGRTYTLNRMQFIERNLRSYQLRGDHSFPITPGSKVEWLTALSTTSQDEPDVRFFNYPDDNALGLGGTPTPINPTRYFRELDEQNKNGKFDFTIPFRQWSGDTGNLKFGPFWSSSERDFFDREIFYVQGQGADPFNGDPRDLLHPDDLGVIPVRTNASNGSITFESQYYIQARRSSYFADQDVDAQYAMIDTPVSDRLRFVGGARVETTRMFVEAQSDLSDVPSGATNLVQTDVLPALSLIYSIRSNMFLRASYSHTVARPSFREKAPYRSYDPILDELVDGNLDLQMSEIRNYDLRFEMFPRPGEIYAVSLFYKDLENAIEQRFRQGDANVITYENRPEAEIYGVEFEFRKSLDFIEPLLRDFSLGGNLSLIGSKVPLNDVEIAYKEPRVDDFKDHRPLYDQSPYILNLDLSYDNPNTGTSASVIFNIAGARIVIANPNSADTYEQPAPLLDFVLSQRINRYLSVRFTAKNLLDPKFKRTYGESGDFLYSSYTRGRTFGLSLAAEF